MNNREIIEQLLTSTGREGMADLLQYMRIAGFYLAPCSSQYHLAVDEGLAEHSINVYNVMVRLNDSLQAQIPQDSITIVSLLHDLGKTGQFKKPNYVENILKSGKRSESKPFETNKELLPVPHEIRSIQIAGQFIQLTEHENFAILHHNGLYGDLKYQLQNKETPLQMLLHWSDMWASRVLEV